MEIRRWQRESFQSVRQNNKLAPNTFLTKKCNNGSKYIHAIDNALFYSSILIIACSKSSTSLHILQTHLKISYSIGNRMPSKERTLHCLCKVHDNTTPSLAPLYLNSIWYSPIYEFQHLHIVVSFHHGVYSNLGVAYCIFSVQCIPHRGYRQSRCI